MSPRYPKLVALDLDRTIWTSYLNDKKFGDHGWVHGDLRNNLELVNPTTIRDKRNHSHTLHLANDIPWIIHDLHSHDVKIAIVSRNTNKDLCDRAMWHFRAKDKHGKPRPLTYFIKYDEIVNEPKQNHLRRIHRWSKIPYSEMLFFDSQMSNEITEELLGLTFHYVADTRRALTKEEYKRGLELWRHNRIDARHH